MPSRQVISIFIGLLCGSSSSFARLSMDVSVGFDGNVMAQSWVPVLVEFYNDGPPIEGLVQVSPLQPSRAASYAKPIVLPTNSRKRLWLYPHVGNYEREFDVRLVTANGRVLDETAAQFTTRPGNSRLLASATRSEIKLISQAPSKAETPVYAARMRPAAMPDDAAGYSGLEAFVVSDVAESEWTIGQRQALRNWVALGGHLVISVHNVDNFTRSSYWQEILPIRVSGSEIVSDLNALDTTGQARLSAQTPVAVGELQRGTVRARAGNLPLVVEAPFGRGRVTLFTFSIEREPFRSWTAKETFWRDLLALPDSTPTPNQPQPYPQSMQRMANWGYKTFDDVFRGLLEARLERQISLGWLLALIGCYLVVIGPFDYWLVRHKLKRPVLTWVTFPSYVIGFSALIYGIGYSLKSGDSELIQVSFVDVVPEANLARGTTVAGFYSTSNRRYLFAGGCAESHFRFCSSGVDTPSATPFSGSETQVIETDQGFMANVPVPIWSSKAFITQWATADKPLTASLRQEDGRQRLNLRNHLPVKLTGVKVIVRDRVDAVSELGPGESREIELAGLSSAGSFDGWLNELASPSTINFLQVVGFGWHRPNVKELPPWETMMPLMSFAEKIRQMPEHARLTNWRGIDLSPELDGGKLIVLAYAENYAQNGLQAKFKTDRREHHALFRCVITQ